MLSCLKKCGKVNSAHESSVDCFSKVINGCFDELVFVLSDKVVLLSLQLREGWFRGEDFSNYCPFSNLSFLSKLTEGAVLSSWCNLLIKWHNSFIVICL